MESAYRQDEARNVLILAIKTGWREADILALPIERRNTYIALLNELYSKDGN
jgi:hypothetical protein